MEEKMKRAVTLLVIVLITATAVAAPSDSWQQFTGEYRMTVTGSRSIWHNKIIKIKQIRWVPSKKANQKLQVSAVMGVPQHWDYTDPVAVDTVLTIKYDPKAGKFVMNTLTLSRLMNLSCMDKTQHYQFHGKWDPARQLFAGEYIVNKVKQGSFTAVPVKR